MAEHAQHQATSFEAPPSDRIATVTHAAPARSKPEKKEGQLPPFKVLLHNDEENSFDHVIRSVMQLTGLKVEDAFDKTMEAHEKGVALLLVTHKERAELYHDQFQSVKITTSVEAA